MAATPEQRKANLRLAVVLASAAVILGIGFVVRIAFFGA